MLRRFGVARDDAEDAAQEVFWIAARRLTDIKQGSERSFLFGTAIRVAAEARRKHSQSREYALPEPLEAAVAETNPEALVATKLALTLVDQVVGGMDDGVREVFVLFELEGIEIKEIAQLMQIPIGTVGSRLRKARQQFSKRAAQLRARLGLEGMS